MNIKKSIALTILVTGLIANVNTFTRESHRASEHPSHVNSGRNASHTSSTRSASHLNGAHAASSSHANVSHPAAQSYRGDHNDHHYGRYGNGHWNNNGNWGAYGAAVGVGAGLGYGYGDYDDGDYYDNTDVIVDPSVDTLTEPAIEYVEEDAAYPVYVGAQDYDDATPYNTWE